MFPPTPRLRRDKGTKAVIVERRRQDGKKTNQETRKGSTYFVFVDNCWVAVDVDGFVYTERVICPGEPDYIVID